MRLFTRRILELPVVTGPIAVTITGSGETFHCHVIVNSKAYTAAASGIEVVPGDAVVFCVYGSEVYNGTVTIDGVTVLTTSSRDAEEYEWTVPTGITAIAIELALSGSAASQSGTITVTTS